MWKFLCCCRATSLKKQHCWSNVSVLRNLIHLLHASLFFKLSLLETSRVSVSIMLLGKILKHEHNFKPRHMPKSMELLTCLELCACLSILFMNNPMKTILLWLSKCKQCAHLYMRVFWSMDMPFSSVFELSLITCPKTKNNGLNFQK